MTGDDRMKAWQRSLIVRPTPVRPCAMSAVDTDGHPMDCIEESGHAGYHRAPDGTVWGNTESWEYSPVKRPERPDYLRFVDPATGMRHGTIRYYNDLPPRSSGCRWCGVTAEFHHGGGAIPGRPHNYARPTAAQIKLRMIGRRRHRKAY